MGTVKWSTPCFHKEKTPREAAKQHRRAFRRMCGAVASRNCRPAQVSEDLRGLAAPGLNRIIAPLIAQNELLGYLYIDMAADLRRL